MTQETQESVNQQEENNENSKQQNESNQPKSYTQDEVDKILKDRLYQKEMENKRKHEKTMKRLEELEAKEKAGTATHEERMELSSGKTAQANAQQASSQDQMIPVGAIPHITYEKMADTKYREKITSAYNSDPDFKKAADSEDAKILVSPDQQFFVRDLENSPAVLKKLLTDKKENNLMQAKYQEAIAHGKPSIMVEYINSLSEKLEKSAIKPRASSYTPDSDLSDFGDSSQDFDLKKYVSNHR